MTIRRRCGTPDPPAGSTVRGTSVSHDACLPAASLSNKATQVASISSPRAPTRLSHILTVQYRRREPVSPARFPSIRVQFRRREHAPRARFPSAMVRVRGKEPTLTVPFPSAAVINSATGIRVSNAAPLNHGTGSGASRAAPPSTRRAALRLLHRRVTLLSERVHPLRHLTRW